MKVCMFECSQGLGRGEVYVDLANAMIGREEVEEVSIVAPRGVKYKGRLHPDVRLVEYEDKGSRRNPFLLWRLAMIFRKLKPDLVHCHFAKSATIFKSIQWLVGCAWCATKHNPRKGKIFTKVKHVTAVSQVVAESIPGRNDVRVISNGIDAEPVGFSGLSPNGVIKFLVVGRLEPIKRYDALVRALAATGRDDWSLSVAGDGVQRAELEQLVAELGVGDKVSLLGFREDVKELMMNHHCTVISSQSEGFSLTMLEAFFYSPLLISTPVSGCVDLLSEDFLMDWDNMEGKLLDVMSRYDEMEERFHVLAQAKQPSLTLDSSVDSYLKFYSEILASK